MFINIINSFYNSNSKAETIDDYGIISLMYHRFDENKYPSTNIRMGDIKEHIYTIKNEGIEFVNPKDFESNLSLHQQDIHVNDYDFR